MFCSLELHCKVRRRIKKLLFNSRGKIIAFHLNIKIHVTILYKVRFYSVDIVAPGGIDAGDV